MATPTTAELLDAAKTALLTALQTGQEVTFGDRRYTSHNLDQLRAIVAGLERAVAVAAGGTSYRLAATSKGTDDAV